MNFPNVALKNPEIFFITGVEGVSLTGGKGISKAGKGTEGRK